MPLRFTSPDDGRAGEIRTHGRSCAAARPRRRSPSGRCAAFSARCCARSAQTGRGAGARASRAPPDDAQPRTGAPYRGSKVGTGAPLRDVNRRRLDVSAGPPQPLLLVVHVPDGEIDALVPPPALLFDPHLVEHSFELRRQVWRRLGPRRAPPLWSLRVHCQTTLPVAGRRVNGRPHRAGPPRPPRDGRLSYCRSTRQRGEGA